MSEIIGTTLLLIGVGSIFAKISLELAVGIGPYLVGVLAWGIGLSLGGTTGYAINLAHDLAPRIAHALLSISGEGSSDWGYAWVPVVGLCIAAALAWALFKFVV